MRSLTDVLARDYGLPGATLTPISGGHTNECFFVDAAGRRLVLRVARQVTRSGSLEASLLDVLDLLGKAPRLCRTLQHEAYASVEGREVTLFEALPGEALRGRPTVAQTMAALHTLAELHIWMMCLGYYPHDPVSWLRLNACRALRGPETPWPADVVVALPRVRRRIAELIQIIPARLPGQRVRWLHGDYHPGNVLFDGDAVTGAVDFEECGSGLAAIDLAVGLYSFSRDPAHEPTLRFDPDRWRAGAAAYAARAGECFWSEPNPLAEAIFCAHQVLIHLDASRRGLWALAPGIGFYPCLNALCGDGAR